MSTYPGTLDDLGATNPASSDAMNSGAGHASQHSEANDAIDAIESTLGTSPLTRFLANAKGDLIVATAADTFDRLAVGTNDYVLTADSSQSTGVKWAAAGGGGGGGLVLVDSGTFSAASSFSLPNGSFDSTYDDYLLILSFAASTDATLRCRLRASGTDESGSVYYSQRFGAYVGGNFAAADPDGATWEHLNYVTSSTRGAHRVEIFDPANTLQTSFIGHGVGSYSAAPVHQNAFGHAATTTAYDALTIAMSTGNMTGRWVLYGYEK